MTTPRRTKISLPDVAVVASQGIEAVAKRVDGVLEHLTEQLSNFEAADTSTISGTPASSVISGARSMYYQTFEDDVDEDWDLVSGSKAAITYPNNGKAGGRAFRTTNKEVYLADNVRIPFDPARLYRIRTRYRDVAGTTRGAYVGVACYEADGTTLIGYANVCLADTTNSGTWAVATGYFKNASGTTVWTSPSTDSSSPRTLHEDTRYISPFLRLSAGGDDQTAELDYITMEILTETSEANDLVTEVGGRAVTDVASTIRAGGTVATNQVSNDGLQADSVDGGGTGGKNVVKAGTLVADNIKAYTIQALQLGSLTGAGLTINFAADGVVVPNVLDHPKFYITVAGDAVFAGTVAATNFIGTTATFTGEVEVEAGEGTTVIGMYTTGIAGLLRLASTVGGTSIWDISNDGGNNLRIQQPAGDDYDGYVSLPDAHLKSAHAIYSYGILTNDLNSTLMDVFDSDGHPYTYLKTNNTLARTMTRFSAHVDMQAGQWAFVQCDSNTTWDFSSNANLKGNGGVDYVCDGTEVLLFLCVSGYSGNVWKLVGNMTDTSSFYESGDNASFGTLASSGLATLNSAKITNALEIDGALNHDGSTVGFYQATPATQDTGWEEFTNLTTTKTLDADSTTVGEVADVLGSLIAQLVVLGLLSDVT